MKGKVPRRSNRWVVKHDGPHPTDVYAGNRVRQRRTLLGMSQETLGMKLGVSFQQLQKYEHGANRISASMLARLAKILDVGVMYFFEGLEEGAPTPEVVKGPETSREALELSRGFGDIKDPEQRKKLLQLTNALATSNDWGK